jgi:SAM-dependent methyltransferase
LSDYRPETYGDRWAAIYDEWVTHVRMDADTAAGFLASLAGGGPALELAIGTGRVALPLKARGVEVHGIDASDAMVAKLREKPGGADIPVTMGDFADVGVDGSYPLIYVPFNTFFGLLKQDDQLRCFRNVASHLTDDGVFVVEAFVPDTTRFDRGQRLQAMRVDLDETHFEVAVHDPVEQRVTTNILVVKDGAIDQYPVQLRYAYPAELDLMAQLAGMRLRDRFGGWNREPFTAASGAHVSVYERARS